MFARIVLPLLLLMLAACGPDIPNIKPPDFKVSKNVPKNELQVRFDSVTTLLNKIQKPQQAMFEERSRGTDYSEAMKLRLETIIKLNRTMAENAVELDNGCASVPRTYTEIVKSCKDFAMKVFKASKTSDEFYQLMLGYTYAGLEKNAAFLTDRNEQRANELIKKQHTLSVAIEKPMYVFAKILQQTNCCDIQPRKRQKSKLRVIFSTIGENAAPKRLSDAIQQASKNTVLVERPTKIIIKIAELDFQGTVDQVARVLTMAVIGIPIFGLPGSGGDATASASVSVQGENYQLNLNTFDINARDQDMLTNMLANRIVGAAHFAVLDSMIAKR
ncbi:MAG TPA: hypothetical protein ENI77_09435 [Nitrospirae bacterium]|nr:hypothetical protein [Nitrospirota bacterium]